MIEAEKIIVYRLLNPTTGKVVSESSSMEHCLREAAWRAPAKFTIAEIDRGGWCGMLAKADRFGSRWPPAKLAEFGRQWAANVSARELRQFFDIEDVAKIRKKLGLPVREQIRPAPKVRIKKEMPPRATIGGQLFRAKLRAWDRAQRYQRHLKTQEEKFGLIFPEPHNPYPQPRQTASDLHGSERAELMNFMFSEGASLDEIAQHFGLKAGTVALQLKATAAEFGNERRLKIERRRRRGTGTKEVPAEVADAGWPIVYFTRGRVPCSTLPASLAKKFKRKRPRRTSRRRFIAYCGQLLRTHGVRPPADDRTIPPILLASSE